MPCTVPLFTLVLLPKVMLFAMVTVYPVLKKLKMNISKQKHWFYCWPFNSHMYTA